jgi:methylated-DNA-[protein]-cysteine S-methyltransferase
VSARAEIASLVERLKRHWAGAPQRYDDVQLELSGVPPFHRAVYVAARGLEVGHTCTYGELAVCLGVPGAARAVGQALARNPFPLVVPCHRVLAAGGRPGGFSAPGGLSTKARLLEAEGVVLRLSGR